jgi:hypothetical protein
MLTKFAKKEKTFRTRRSLEDVTFSEHKTEWCLSKASSMECSENAAFGLRAQDVFWLLLWFGFFFEPKKK